MKEKLNIYYGEMHDNTHQVYDPEFNMDHVLNLAKSHLDFYGAAYYPCTSAAFCDGGHPSDQNGSLPLNIESWKDGETIEKEWKQSCESIAKFNTRGEFITFPGYEWQGNARSGDHNVFYFEDHPEIFKSDSLKELYAALEGLKALAIPHHTAYLPGFRGKDWSLINPKISPFSEVFSIHGSSEGDMWGGSLIDNAFLAPDITESSYSAALKRGLIVGAIGSTDNWGKFPGHYGHGLAAVLAEDLSRESLWEAFRKRRVYALTGDRIKLDFTINGHSMGSEIPQSDEINMDISVEGEDALEYIEVVKNEETFQMLTPPFESDYSGDTKRYKIRFEYGWGPSDSYAEMEDKEWSGKITVKDGSIESVSPLLVDGKHTFNHDGNCFTFHSFVNQVDADYPHHNSFILCLSLNEESQLSFDINGRKCELNMKKLKNESTALFFTDESVKLLKERFEVDTDNLYRDDIIYGMAYKCKIHRMIPETRYAQKISLSDKTGDSSHYRVRVRQRNGQMALSSPIWLKQ